LGAFIEKIVLNFGCFAERQQSIHGKNYLQNQTIEHKWDISGYLMVMDPK
jgi:hypothetical protein